MVNCCKLYLSGERSFGMGGVEFDLSSSSWILLPHVEISSYFLGHCLVIIITSRHCFVWKALQGHDSQLLRCLVGWKCSDIMRSTKLRFCVQKAVFFFIIILFMSKPLCRYWFLRSIQIISNYTTSRWIDNASQCFIKKRFLYNTLFHLYFTRIN